MDGGVLAALGQAHNGRATGSRDGGAERAPRRRRDASAEREAGRGDGGGRGRRRRRGRGDGDGEAGGHRGGWTGTGVRRGVGKPGAVRCGKGKVVGRELECGAVWGGLDWRSELVALRSACQMPMR